MTPFGAALMIKMAVRALPEAVRDRYRRELMAELRDTRQAYRFAWRVLVRAPALRAAVQPALAHRPLQCRLHVHHFATLSTEDGLRFRRCVRCGVDDDGTFRSVPNTATLSNLSNLH